MKKITVRLWLGDLIWFAIKFFVFICCFVFICQTLFVVIDFGECYWDCVGDSVDCVADQTDEREKRQQHKQK